MFFVLWVFIGQFTVIGKYFETACACHNVKQSVTKMTQLLKRVTIQNMFNI